MQFLEHFMCQWIVRIRPEMWNVRGRIHRTNNDLESWHNRINQDVGKSKNVFFFQALMNDHIDSTVLECQLQSGLAIVSGQRKDVEKKASIARMEQDLESGKNDAKEFCLAVGSLMAK